MSGFFHTPDPTAYNFGSGELSGAVLQPDGQWDAFLPEEENQLENGYDPADCASIGTEHCVSTLIKRQFKV